MSTVVFQHRDLGPLTVHVRDKHDAEMFGITVEGFLLGRDVTVASTNGVEFNLAAVDRIEVTR